MSAWIVGREAEFVDCLRAEMTSGQIATHFKISRNSVVSMVRRKFSHIGFQSDIAKARKIAEPTRKPYGGGGERKRVERKKSLPPVFVAIETTDFGDGVPLRDLGPDQCRFAVNDAPTGALHMFCGAETDGGPWCARHLRMVYGSGTESERAAHRVLLAAS